MLLIVACAARWLAAAPAAAAQVDVISVVTSAADRHASLLADVRPAPTDPLPAGAFAVTAGDARLPTQATAMMSDGLAAAVVVDSSTAGASTLQGALNGAAGFLLQVPVGARVAAVADTGPPKVLATAAAGAKDALGALNGIRPAGDRSTAAALEVALGQLPPAVAGEPRLVLLATNGPDAGDEPARALAERLHRAGAMLAVVTTATNTSYWSRVTEETGGVLVKAEPSTVAGAFDAVADTLRARYLITFPLPERLPATVSVRVDTADGPVSTDAYLPAPGTDVTARKPGPGAGLPPILALGGALVLLLSAALWFIRRPASRSPEAAAPKPERSRQAAAEAAGTGPEADSAGANASLFAYVGTTAAAVADERTDEQHAVAQIALAAAGCPGLLDRVADTERRTADTRFSDWPPTAVTLHLIAAARRVTTGETALVGPAGIRVQQAEATGNDGTRHPVFRLTRNGRQVCDCQTVPELSRHVDLDSLLADHRSR